MYKLVGVVVLFACIEYI